MRMVRMMMMRTSSSWCATMDLGECQFVLYSCMNITADRQSSSSAAILRERSHTRVILMLAPHVPATALTASTTCAHVR